MNVTVICDASYCHEYKVAGYGYWIASARGKSGGSGKVIADVENNNTAEMMAIVNTLWHGVNDLKILRGDTVLIQSDCTSAMSKLNGLQECITQQEKQVQKHYLDSITQFDIVVRFKHVRGHTVNPDSRSVANRMCDKRAKREMRLARINKINGISNAS